MNLFSSVQPTSVETYYKITNNGMLSESRLKVYKAVYHYEDKTAREIMRLLGMETNQSGRFTELKERGVITESGSRVCTVTGNRAITWRTTDSLPVKPSKKKKIMVYMELEMITRLIQAKYNLSPEEVQDLQTTLLTEMKKGKA